jgi:hypothetical protein
MTEQIAQRNLCHTGIATLASGRGLPSPWELHAGSRG